MNDIVDIYEPIYETPNYLFIVVIAIGVVALITVTLFLIIISRKKSVVTLETKYKSSLDNILFLKGKVGKLQSKEFLKDANEILFNYIFYQLSENYNSLTSSEIVQNLNNLSLENQYIKEFFTNKNDHILYGKDTFENQDREKHLKEYGELITTLYRRTLND